MNEKDFDVVQVKYNGKAFYVFECLQENTYDDFSNICFSIQQAIGFINKLTRITLATFSKLVCKIHNEPEFSAAI